MITDEVVHPSILEIQKNSKSSFIMALTPWPNMDARWENPSIVISDNGIQWHEGIVKNPLFPPPKNAVSAAGPHNCDPNIIWNSESKKAFLYFINWGDRYKHLRLLTSADFTNWKDLGLTNIEVILKDNQIRVSPSIVYLNEEKKFVAFLVRADLNMKEPSFIEVFTSNNGLFWNKTGETHNVFSVYNNTKFLPWHLSIRKVENKYWMMAAMNYGKLSYPPIHVFFFLSDDGFGWTGSEHPVLTTSSAGFDSEKLYHADFTVVDGKIKLWYSAMSRNKKFKIFYISGKVTAKKSRSDNVICL